MDGVTTNPTLLSREKRTDLLEQLISIRKIIGPDRMRHVQTLQKTAEVIVREGVALKEPLTNPDPKL